MPITLEELTNTETDTPEPADESVRIVDWVDEMPAVRRRCEFDGVVNQLRTINDPTKIALIEADRPINANRANYLRGRYPDILICQKNGQTFMRVRTPEELASKASKRATAA